MIGVGETNCRIPGCWMWATCFNQKNLMARLGLQGSKIILVGL